MKIETPRQYSTTFVPTGNQFYDSMPAPGYEAGYDPLSMSSVDQLEELFGKYSEGYNKFKDEALRDGPSKWLNMNLLRGDIETRTGKEKARREANAVVAEDLDRLAAGGGLTSGARERAGEAGIKNYLGMSQDLTKQDMLNDLSLGIQDEGNRLNMMAQLPGMETGRVNQWASARDTDINRQLSEKDRLNQFNMNLYNQRMMAAAAERQAQATENSGGGGGLFDCFITTTMVHHFGLPDQCHTMQTLRRFRDEYMLSTKDRADEVSQYYKLSEIYAPKLQELDSTLAWSTIKKMIDESVRFIDSGHYPEAHANYKKLVEYVVGLFPAQEV